MSDVYLLQHSDMDANFPLGIFTELALAEKAMHVWVEGENTRRQAYDAPERLYVLDTHERNHGLLAFEAEFDWVNLIPITPDELKDWWRNDY